MSKRATGLSPVFSVVFVCIAVILISGCIGESSPYDPSRRGDVNQEAPQVVGLWDEDPPTLATRTAPADAEPVITGQSLQIADNGDVFLSYTAASAAGDEQLTVLRAAAPGHAWTSADDPMMMPVDMGNGPASMAQFAVNGSNGDGYALWDDGSGLQVSEFMSGMGHFMTRASVGSGHSPRFLVSDGSAYLLTQSHMDNGFGFNVVQRTGVGAWSAPVQLHRMGSDAATAITMPDHVLAATVNGQGNILVLWLEQQGDVFRLMSTTYNVEAGDWSDPAAVLDSGAAGELDLASVTGLGVTGEAGSNAAHVVLFTGGGNTKAVYTLDFDGAWQAPARADAQNTVSSDIAYVTSSGHLVAAWVETANAVHTVKALRFAAATGWQPVADVAMVAMGAEVSHLRLALNVSGHAVAAWVETAADSARVYASLQKSEGPWLAKELVQTVADGGSVLAPAVAMHSDGTPWVVSTRSGTTGGEVNFVLNLIRRSVNIDQAADRDQDQDGDGDSAPGTGSDPGTGGSDPGTGSGDPGTGTDDPGTGTDDPGTGTTDPGTGGSGGSGGTSGVEPGTDYVAGYWNASEMLASAGRPAADEPGVISRRLAVTDGGHVFHSWSALSAGSESFTLMRATDDGSGTYTWSDPASAMFVPLNITDAAANVRFTANPVNGDGYAVWEDGGVLKLSEFMGGMGHFMNTTDVGEGHAPRVLVDSAGVAYLVKQSHMMNGFGLDVSIRAAMGDWGAPVQLHRMGMDEATAINMPDHFFTVAVDGQDNVAAVWLETQGGVTRLMSAVYDTAAAGWGSPLTILDSDHSHGIDLTALASVALVGEENTSNLHLVLFEDTGEVKTLHSVDFTADAWGEPVRRDMDMGGMATIVGEPKYAADAAGHLLAVWVESHAEAVHIKSLRLNLNTWSAVENVAAPAADATITNLGAAVNHHGDVLVTWAEGDAGGARVLASLQTAGSSWAQKEMVEEVASPNQVANLVGTLSHSGMPWVAWTMSMAMGGDATLMSHVSMRRDSIESTTLPGTGTDPGAGDGTTDPGTGGGTTDPGTGGGTANPDTGGGTTDPNTGGGTTDPGTGGVAGLWEQGTMIAMAQAPAASEAATAAPTIQTDDNGNVFLSWRTEAGHDAGPAHREQDIIIVRGVPAASGGYTWSDPANAMMKPSGFDTHSKVSPLVVNPVTGDAFANWRTEAATLVSEFMGSMGHFMSNVQFPASDRSQVLVDSAGEVYLLTKTPMTGGFGLNVHARTGFDQWTDPVQLHRMDMADAYAMPNDFMIAAVDGLDNIRVVWLEEHAGVMSLQAATYHSGTATWGTVSEVHAHGAALNKVVSAFASGTPGTPALQVVLHQQDGAERTLFALPYDETTGWAEPLRLDTESAALKVVSTPSFAHNSAGKLVVGWIETDESMTAGNTDGLMHMIVTRTYTLADGWGDVANVAHAGATAEASSLQVSVGATGDATAVWLESSDGGSGLFASHKRQNNDSWSRKELIDTVVHGDGSVQALNVGLNGSNVPLVLLGTRTIDGVDHMLHVTRIARLTAIGDAQTGSTTDPGAGDGAGGGGTNDPGTGSGSGGTADPGTPLLPSVNWTAPEMVGEMVHSTSTTRFFGPQVVKDDVGGTVIKMSMADLNVGSGTSTAAMHNHIIRSVNHGPWQDIFMDSGLLDDLTASAIVETVSVIPTTGNLYGVIRDGDKLYLARYLADVGWSKMEIPGVSARTLQHNLQLTTNETGMATLIWHTVSDTCCTADIHAKHYMVSGGWQDTATITVDAEAVLTPHILEVGGQVHVAWLVTNPDASVGGYLMQTAIYTPMAGWSGASNGPAALPNSLAKAGSSGTYQMAAVGDPAANRIDAYVLGADGTWVQFGNINQKADGDGIRLIDTRDMQVISGGERNFMVIWREHVDNLDGSSEVRYRTASVYRMTDPATNDDTWHWGDPTEVGGANQEVESNLNFAMDGAGNAYAVWSSVDSSAETSHVYVNKVAMMGEWAPTPELLAEYDIASGSTARNTSISINALDEVGIAWDQHTATSATSTHYVWAVEAQ